ncbi:UNVERIFIED_CONTAM: AMP deaminase [Sesamum calycinum]|uniref:AMP deaminase n=1 Tax=Sesamum calycinum TaxID=2727403 RepID=A0AAW2K745_9LAMI
MWGKQGQKLYCRNLQPQRFISSYSGNVVRCSGTENENALTRHLIRPTSPKSPLACASAFESPEGSDDEDNVTDVAKLDTTYLLTNGNVVAKPKFIHESGKNECRLWRSERLRTQA